MYRPPSGFSMRNGGPFRSPGPCFPPFPVDFSPELAPPPFDIAELDWSPERFAGRHRSRRIEARRRRRYTRRLYNGDLVDVVSEFAQRADDRLAVTGQAAIGFEILDFKFNREPLAGEAQRCGDHAELRGMQLDLERPCRSMCRGSMNRVHDGAVFDPPSRVLPAMESTRTRVVDAIGAGTFCCETTVTRGAALTGSVASGRLSPPDA